MWRAARVLVAGARATSFQPCSGLRCGLRLSAGARQLRGRGGLGAAGRQGAEGFGPDRSLSGLAAPFCTTLLGWAAGVQVQGASRQLDCPWGPGRFFAVWRALPTFIFALLA